MTEAPLHVVQWLAALSRFWAPGFEAPAALAVHTLHLEKKDPRQRRRTHVRSALGAIHGRAVEEELDVAQADAGRAACDARRVYGY